MFSLDNTEKNVILAPYTTYKIGGPADYFYLAKNKQDLVSAVIFARKNKIPYFVLGLGANILIGDKGFRGLVIKNGANNFNFNNNFLISESGTNISDLISICKQKSFSGLEHFSGIPSTVGGAIWQNLHFLTPDRKSTFFIESIIYEAEILDDNNVIRKVKKDYFEFGYDKSILHFKDILVTEVTFELIERNIESIEIQISENLKWRNEKQPSLEEFPSCGSVFKKIEGAGAGRLIEQVGLKGFKVGNAMISHKHANFIVNLGGASAKDVIEIINQVKKSVKQKLNLEMETEIKMIGEF